MQKTSYYPLESYENEKYKPEITIIMTQNLKTEKHPNDRLIAACVDYNVTRVFNSDY